MAQLRCRRHFSLFGTVEIVPRCEGLNVFGISGFELFLILLFGFLIFGPDKLPQIAKVVGQAVQKFRNAQSEMSKVVKTEIYDPIAEDPVKNPLDAIDKDNKQKVEKKESFASRKAKYDKERAEKRKREAANEAAKEARATAATAGKEKKAAAGAAGGAAAGVATAAKTSSTTKTSSSKVHEKVMEARKEAAARAAAEEASLATAKKELADELLGTKKPVRKSARKDTADTSVAKTTSSGSSTFTKSVGAASDDAAVCAQKEEN